MLELKFIEAFTALTDELVTLLDLRLLLNAIPLINPPSTSRGALGFNPLTDFYFFPDYILSLEVDEGVFGMTGLPAEEKLLFPRVVEGLLLSVTTVELFVARMLLLNSMDEDTCL